MSTGNRTIAAQLAAGMMEIIRLDILRLLDAQPTYSANDDVLTMALRAIGHDLARHQLRAQIDWLAEVGTIDRVAHGSGLVVATLTQRGGDVAKGRSAIGGIARPQPGAGLHAG